MFIVNSFRDDDPACVENLVQQRKTDCPNAAKSKTNEVECDQAIGSHHKRNAYYFDVVAPHGAYPISPITATFPVIGEGRRQRLASMDWNVSLICGRYNSDRI